MKRTTRYWAIVILFVAGTARAEGPAPAKEKMWYDGVTLSVSNRIRGEFVDWFDPKPGNAPGSAQRYNFMGNQLRFGMKAESPGAMIFLEGQDTRLVSLPANASPPNSKAGNLGPGAVYYANTHDRDQGETFLKQGYITLRQIPGLEGAAFTGGRFEYGDGLEVLPTDPSLLWLKRQRISERLVGSFGFTHVTRSVDGVKGTYDTPVLNLTAFGSRPTMGGFEVSANRELDVYLAGAAATLKQVKDWVPLDVRLFYLYYNDQRADAVKTDNRVRSVPANAPKNDKGNIEISTVGANVVTVVDAGPGKWDGLLWGAVQGGDWGTQDHVAWGYAVETGYQLPGVFAAPWLRVGYNRTAGDQDPNDDDHETFFQILPTARMYAQTPFYNLMNSSDFFTQFILKPIQMVTWRTDYHWLQLTSANDLWYSGGGATNNNFFGYQGLQVKGRNELAHVVESSLTVNPIKPLTVYGYYGYAFGQGAVRNLFDGTTGNYGYIEMTMRY